MITISSRIVGSNIRPYYFQVNSRQMQNYAASLFDENSLYYSSTISNEILAHPLFPVRISWQVIDLLDDLLSVKLPKNVLDYLLHQSEYMIIHRLLKPDDELTIQGKIVALYPHKLGAKITIKLDYIDLQNRPVLAEFITAVLVKVQCTDEGNSISETPITERISLSSPIWEENIPISRFMPYIYDGCNDINFPIHTDPRYARSKGLPDIILQGTATLAKSVSTIIQKELNNDPRRIKVISGKFTDMVIPPNLLSLRVFKKNQHNVYFDVTDQDGKFVVKGGFINFI